jgi:hypothetical protein
VRDEQGDRCRAEANGPSERAHDVVMGCESRAS